MYFPKSLLKQPQNRYQAFAVHLGISAIIFIVLAAIIILVWYPGFLFSTDGGWNGIRLIAGVDFVIGPALTLIVYRVDKRGLKTDLTLIAIIQLACLTAGTWIVYQERPIAVIYFDGQFQPKSHEFFTGYKIDPGEVFKLDDEVPAWIYIELPEDEKKRLQALWEQFQKGPVYAQVDRFRPYRENIDKVMQKAIDPAKLDPEIAREITPSGKVFHYTARYGSGYIEIDGNTGEYINIH